MTIVALLHSEEAIWLRELEALRGRRLACERCRLACECPSLLASSG
ncbi:23528_t:CDS:2 [Gigaspora rosea]|nr:23528_t:CDS:2 [Gigaspora rosea]